MYNCINCGESAEFYCTSCDVTFYCSKKCQKEHWVYHKLQCKILNSSYKLIGVGDFSHGDENIWQYRFNLLKFFINVTDKNLVIFIEDTKNHSYNIMNIEEELIIDKKYGLYEGKYPYGPLEKYCFRLYDSPIYLEIIKYIRKHQKRITIIGVDNNKLERDKEMAERILNNLYEKNVNFFWAHNDHIDDREITALYETKWQSEKYYCGYYLKKKLQDKYCIVLSTGYEGQIRFDGSCNNKECSERISFVKPIFKKFIIPKYDKYNYSGLYENFNNDKIAEFAATTFPENKPFMMKKSKSVNYVLFFRNINPLLMITLM